MIYEALFLPVTEEKERRERVIKTGGGEKRRMERRESKEQTQGEGGQENAEETSITLRPLG